MEHYKLIFIMEHNKFIIFLKTIELFYYRKQ
jgi:hypothetical protein